MMKLRLIINGKKAGLAPLREAIFKARETGEIEVRATWEGDDVRRLIAEAAADGCQRVVVGGGDGTVKDAVDAILKLPLEQQPELAILPLGTANDFATACALPKDHYQALSFAQTGSSINIDAVRANDTHFVNVASGGFGAQVTSSTPVALKNFLGGGAYTISGLVQAINFNPYSGTARAPGIEITDEVILTAVCNGRQAGGGQQLAGNAKINDGLLDVVYLKNFAPEAVAQVIREILDPSIDGDYVQRFRAPWIEWSSDVEMPINLDGEPIFSKSIRFEVLPGAIRLVLPPECPLILNSE